MMPHQRWALLKSPMARAAILPILVAAPFVVVKTGEPSVTSVVFAFYLLLAVVFESWLIFGTLIGAAIGAWADPAVKGGTPVSQVLETAEYWLVGTAFGVVIGFAIEAGRRPRPRQSTESHDEAIREERWPPSYQHTTGT